MTTAQEERSPEVQQHIAAGRDAPARVRGGGWTGVGQTIGAKYGLLVVFALLIAAFSALNGSIFFTVQNAQTIASTQAVVAILALAVLVPFVTGQFDLSVAFQLGLAQAICTTLLVQHNAPSWLAVACTLISGALFGAVNGLIVVRLRINAFITTLATGTLGQGLLQVVTNGTVVFGNMPSGFLGLGRNAVLGIPLPFIYVLGFGVVLWVALEYTRWGRRCFATGGNPRAALLAGVNVSWVTFQSFVIAGVLAACAGVLSTMILGAAQPDVGPQYLLPSFAGALLGATSIRPGRFNVWGTVVAVYFLATGITGLQQLGVPFYIEQFFNGGALLIAVLFSQTVAERRRRRVAEQAQPYGGDG
jgi:ribose transport system permease protein